MAVHSYLIKVNYYTMVKKLIKNVFHYALELRGCITQSKWHDNPFVSPVKTPKDNFILVIRMHRQLIVSVT